MTPERSTFELLHHLWTKAVGTPNYVKKEWQELEARLLKLEKDVKAHVGGDKL